MEVADYEHGVPSWVDLGTTDLDGARAFYASLFGWATPEGPPEAGGYTLASLDDKMVAGIGPLMDPTVPPVWTTYVNVEDADAVVAKVKEARGQVLAGPMDVMEAGRMAILADSQGAVFGIWQAGVHKGAGLVNAPSTYCWSELVTEDPEAAKAFYTQVFGWGSAPQGDSYTEWQVGGRPIGGLMAKPAEMPAEVPPHWGVYFAVADVDATAKAIGELGGSVVMGPVDIEPGRFAVAADPAGAYFNVIALKAEVGG